MPLKTNHTLHYLLVIALIALTTACATVKPWERGNLADPVMTGEVAPDTVSCEQAVVATVEASSGGYGIAGGGCGCN